jgi:hypothetical protein
MSRNDDRMVSVTGPDGSYVTLSFFVAEGSDWRMVEESLYYIGDAKGWSTLGNTIRAWMVEGIR